MKVDPMNDLPERLLYEGVGIDFEFRAPRPSFGDLFRLCGDIHPRFPPTGDFGFERLADLQFDQVDDYFGIRSMSGEGEDVPIWLYPLIGGAVTHHHPGPFDSVRITYNVLRNPIRRADHFLRCAHELASLAARVTYNSRGIALGSPPDLAPVRADVESIACYWERGGIIVGTDDALAVDF